MENEKDVTNVDTDTRTDGHSEYNVNPTSRYSTRILNDNDGDDDGLVCMATGNVRRGPA